MMNTNNTTIEKTKTQYLTSDTVKFWKFNNKLGLSKILYGIDYQRCLEYPVAFNQLSLNEDVSTYLDIGTGKYSIFPLYVAHRCPDLIMRLTDINSHVFKQLKYINRDKILKDSYNHSRITIEKQDARCLTYEDNSFDRIAAISSIEHIPDDGDSQAMKEIMRVLKPGGKAIITVPYKHSGYEAMFRKPRKPTDDNKLEFFSHFYNEQALNERLINTGDYLLENITYLGEKDFAYFDFLRTKVPIRNTLKYFLGWTNPIAALKLYSILSDEDKSKAHVAVITLSKR